MMIWRRKGANASAAVILTYFSGNTQVSSPHSCIIMFYTFGMQEYNAVFYFFRTGILIFRFK